MSADRRTVGGWWWEEYRAKTPRSLPGCLLTVYLFSPPGLKALIYVTRGLKAESPKGNVCFWDSVGLEGGWKERRTSDLGICCFPGGGAFFRKLDSLWGGVMGLAWDHEKMSKHKPPWTVLVTLGRAAHVLFTGTMGSRFCWWKISWKMYPRGKKPGILNGQIFKICQINYLFKKKNYAQLRVWQDGQMDGNINRLTLWGNLVTSRALKMIITLFLEISTMEAEI